MGTLEKASIGHYPVDLCRHERCALSARSDIAGAEVTCDPHAESFRQHRRFTELPRDRRGLMPDGLTVEGDESKIRGAGMRSREQFVNRVRRPFRQTHVELRQCAGSPAGDRLKNLGLFRQTVGTRQKMDQRSSGGALDPHQRGVDPIE